MKVNIAYNVDCLTMLNSIPDNSVDSVVTDPPYGLSKEPNITEMLMHWMNDTEYKHPSSGFMGKSWDSMCPSPVIWREVYRVLKPGGHALVFAGTRTQDLMTISLRMAGFEVRDVIEWLYFSGFPKSHDISKAFDKKAGAKREVIGTKKNPISGSFVYQGFTSLKELEDAASKGLKCPNGRDAKEALLYPSLQAELSITAPSTDLAKQYDGFGTALKPAHEPIILVRKPLMGTVADNVEKHGTGGINIDGCRIGEGNGNEKPEYVPNDKNKVYGKNLGGGEWENTTGRFPANCITLEENEFYSPYFNVTSKELSKKSSKKDRNSDYRGSSIPGTNGHPTVKSLDLMTWLIKLITPYDGVVVDPFSGSGTTLVAAKRLAYADDKYSQLKYIGSELDPDYFEIIQSRLGENFSEDFNSSINYGDDEDER